MIETTQIVTKTGVVDLGIGQPQMDLLPHELMRRSALHRIDGKDNALLNYGPARGDGYLRLALGEFLSPRYGFRVDPATLMATGGATQALALIASRLAKPGDTVLVEEPTYFLAHQIFADCGLNVVGVPIGADGLTPEGLQEAIEKHRPRLLYTIPVHQNPSGFTMAEEHRRPIVELCQRHDILILADEVYQLLTYEGTTPPPLAAHWTSEAVISIGSFSKILAPGLRLGWIQAAEPILNRLTGMGIFASGGGVNHFTGCLVQDALASGGQADYLDNLRQIYRHKVDLMDSLLRQHLPDKVIYQKPQGGYFFWLKLADGRDTESLLPRAADRNVGYRHGARFSTCGAFQDHLRLSFAHYDDQALTQGIERLAAVLS